jgi:hypothetical protein
MDCGRNMWGSKTGLVEGNWKEITPDIAYNTNIMLQNFSVDVREIWKLWLLTVGSLKNISRQMSDENMTTFYATRQCEGTVAVPCEFCLYCTAVWRYCSGAMWSSFYITRQCDGIVAVPCEVGFFIRQMKYTPFMTEKSNLYHIFLKRIGLWLLIYLWVKVLIVIKIRKKRLGKVNYPATRFLKQMPHLSNFL